MTHTAARLVLMSALGILSGSGLPVASMYDRPIVQPGGAGTQRRRAREAARAQQLRELYRDTPPAPITRQRLRNAR